MTVVNINLKNVGSSTSSIDYVTFYSPVYRDGATNNELVSTAEENVPLVDGVATVDLIPGPVRVHFKVRGIADTVAKDGTVPDSGPVSLNAVLQDSLDYTPGLVNSVLAEVDAALVSAISAVEQAVDTELGEAVQTAVDAAESAGTKVDTYTTRLAAVEAMGGLSPQSPVDGQTASLIEQEDTLTRSAVERAADVSMGAKSLAAFGTKFYEASSTGEVVTLAGAPRADVSIASALPDVSLAQVQSIDPDADLSDSADWYLLQSLINDCATRKVRDIKVPRGTYYMSRGLDLSGLEYGTDLDMSGVILRATKEMPRMIWLEHRGNYWKTRRINIRGLEIRGQYLAQRGIDIEGVQEWVIDVRVHSCYIGVAMADTWYGKLSRESIIQDCLTGLAFLQRNTAEINTIGLDNVKINFSTSKSNFTLSPDGDSIGIRISTILAGIDFHALVVEGADYGVKYVPTATGTGHQRGLIMFTGCYWEALKKKVFDFSGLDTPGYIHSLNSVIIRGNRFLNPLASESVFGPGEHEMTGNQAHNIRVLDTPQTRLTIRIDNAVTLAKSPTSPQVFIDRAPTTPTDIYTDRFSPWGNSNSYPRGEAMLHTMQHATYRTTPTLEKLRGLNAGSSSKLYPVYSITSKPTVYHPSVGDSPNGPVLHGEDGWYMLLIGEGGTLTTRRVRNIQRLDEGTTSRSGKELYYMTSTAEVGSAYRCIDMNTEVTLGMVNGQRRWVDSSGNIRIGTTVELLGVATSFTNGVLVFDISTGQASQVWGGIFNLYDWFGDVQGRIAGPLASRPNTPTDGHIYYDTDSGTYTKYSDGSWVSFTPHVTT